MDGLGFILKKVVSRLGFPVGLCLLLALAGMVLWRRRPNSRWGFGLVLTAWLLLLALSLPGTAWLLLSSLESQAGDYADPRLLVAAGVRQVVVLSGGVQQGARPPNDQLRHGALSRVLEGCRLWREMPGAKLVLTGGSFEGGVKEAAAMAALARQLGVPDEAMVLEDESWDTGEQAAMLRPLLGEAPFALVTSAFHMPRSLAVFRAAGLRPLPAPTDFATKGFAFTYNTLLPQANGLHASETAIYEHLGWWWYRFKLFSGLGLGRQAATTSGLGARPSSD